MKKLLIGTSALVAAVAFSGTANAADPLKLGLSGYAAVLFTYADADEDLGGVDNTVDILGDSEVHFKAKTTLDNGLTVAFKSEMEAGGAGNTTAVDEYNISVSGSFGTILAGADDNALAAIAMGAPHYGGRLFVAGNDDGGAMGYMGLASTGNTYVSTGDSEQVSYISPAFAGFTFGASYITMDAEHNYSTLAAEAADAAFGVGLMYNGEFGGVGVGVEGGYANVMNGDDSDMWQIGTELSASGFTFGAAYMLSNNDGSDNDAHTWEVGVGYETGPYGVGLAYVQSEWEMGGAEPTATLLQLTSQYAMGPGVLLVGGVAWGENDPDVAGQDSVDGWTVQTGINLAF